jgi:hypothetical protein
MRHSRIRPCRLAPLVATLVVGLASSLPAADYVLIPQSSTWSYLDNGSDQGSAWTDPLFNDASWASGSAQLGYGDGDEATVVSYGSNGSAKFTTTYFRHSFQANGTAGFVGLTLRLLRDDGAVVHLNGTEIHRSNMPGGGIDYSTFASSALGSPAESTFQTVALDPALLAEGSNVIAVEIHQANLSSSDISFDLELVATDSASVTRGPYLQLGTHESMVVRWRTNTETTSRVAYGSSPSTLDFEVSDVSLSTEHELEIAALAPDTTYYYAIGSLAELFVGGDAAHRFRTAPVAGTPIPSRVWVIGDSGTANADAARVRDSYLDFAGGAPPDVWLMLGDNAYNTGTDSEYQAAVFDMYPQILRAAPVWPTLGNHDGATADSASGTGPYYDIFTLPRAIPPGGPTNGTEAFYSFDWANIHFVCLDSYESDRSPSGAMLSWLEDDLAATTAEWIVAYWHHPPYSKGSHDSDGDTRMSEMRANVLPILEDYGVDLVLGGHSHAYERSRFIDGHYQASSTFAPSMVVQDGDGSLSGDGAYEKPLGPTPHNGAVYVVAGSSGKVSASGALDHAAMYVSLRQLGSLVLDVNGSQLDASFLDDAGNVVDDFTILKGGSSDCDFDGVCEAGEDCVTCRNDCVSGSGEPACGNGVCESANGEDCVTCAADCRGKQKGRADRQYCCGGGAGNNPVACGGNSACTSDGWQCTETAVAAYCCGDGTCDGAEDGFSCGLDCGEPPSCGDGECNGAETSCSCAADCDAPPSSEAGLCDDGIDNDCDGLEGCLDADCAGDDFCGGVCLPLNAACSDASDCCSQKCKGKPGAQVCK